ncbi:RING-H2 zinc finger protein (macronuclear) [Tetrahymena thermophila SB210]|uniref:RING-H2 zinc finger protein n=1 Tax=Tetrahymena thermophila (strain SB210) TaxID=312017 RepID=I7LW58_TETTS|nr:RING-H2 zinc finger protein [Tetrahymena thermophila SB210]EAS00895.2 RING-H2 zinc finger protein [Tetrahymena thermophila SB210]|eukprot:XP_001021141.2 RING-H2 zinc finger protein [Tetrahymena thermophila SB210]
MLLSNRISNREIKEIITLNMFYLLLLSLQKTLLTLQLPKQVLGSKIKQQIAIQQIQTITNILWIEKIQGLLLIQMIIILITISGRTYIFILQIQDQLIRIFLQVILSLLNNTIFQEHKIVVQIIVIIKEFALYLPVIAKKEKLEKIAVLIFRKLNKVNFKLNTINKFGTLHFLNTLIYIQLYKLNQYLFYQLDFNKEYPLYNHPINYFFIDIQNLTNDYIQKSQIQFSADSKISLKILNLLDFSANLNQTLSMLSSPILEKEKSSISFNLNELLQTYKNAKIIVFQVSSQNDASTVQIQVNSQQGQQQNNFTTFYICIGSISFGLVLIVVILMQICKYKERQRKFFQGLARQQTIQNERNYYNEIQVQTKIHSNTQQQDVKKYLPSILFTEKIKAVYQVADFQCSVCLEEFVVGKDQIKVTICNHIFHDACLDEWLTKFQNCPLCRQQHSLSIIKMYFDKNSKIDQKNSSSNISFENQPEIPNEQIANIDLKIQNKQNIINQDKNIQHLNQQLNIDVSEIQNSLILKPLQITLNSPKFEKQQSYQTQQSLINSTPQKIFRQRSFMMINSPLYQNSKQLQNLDAQIMSRQSSFEKNNQQNHTFSTIYKASYCVSQKESQPIKV